ncbi:protein SCO1/2 [Paenibacillus shirakamiensis]|uniref:Protein SCO1/2 n=1 Tax=Paenibacillus shirakamiensis TaxID=1265935 RepID=A0ABS4JK37_9BACL|nr:SCO family protein [Paenibacillus shirakamiensis]MBP2002053.1 protein SCO1/2 [Paenibacillus shirakamiensis]
MYILKKYKLTWILLAVCLVLASYLLINTYTKPKIPTIRPVQNFSLTNWDGKNVTLENTNGKVRLFYFFFSSCTDVCPLATFKLSQVQDQLKKEGVFGKDASFISISFDPTRDTPTELKKFGTKFRADFNSWYFLRGDEKKIQDLAMNSFQIFINKDNKGNFIHADLIALVDKDGNYRKYYQDSVTAEDIAADVSRLAKE